MLNPFSSYELLCKAAYLKPAGQIQSFSFPAQQQSSNLVSANQKRSFSSLTGTESTNTQKKIVPNPLPTPSQKANEPIIPNIVYPKVQIPQVVPQQSKSLRPQLVSDYSNHILARLMEAQYQHMVSQQIALLKSKSLNSQSPSSTVKNIVLKPQARENSLSEDNVSISTAPGGRKNSSSISDSTSEVDHKNSFSDEEDLHSPQPKSQPCEIEPPALFVLTKEFPDWDLGKIAEFINDGKTKDDIVSRDLRSTKKETEKPVVEKKTPKEEDEELSEGEVKEMIEEFTMKLREIFNYKDINQEKVYATLCKNNFEMRKVVTLVKKNVSFYRKYFCGDNEVPAN